MKIIWFNELESTNREAFLRYNEIPRPFVVACKNQTCGKGQGDHTWHSEAGLNLTFSFVQSFPAGILPISNRTELNNAVTSALCSYLANNGITSHVKAPNDIYVGDLKICGILIETILGQNKSIDTVIIGIGLNVNETDFPSDLPNPVSMKMITGCTYNLQQELSDLCLMLEQSIDAHL